MSQWQPQQYDPRQHQQRLGQPQHPYEQPQPDPQGYYPPPPPLRQPPPTRRRSWAARHKVLTALGSLTALIIATGIAAAAASPSPSSPSSSPQAPGTPSHPPAATPPASPAATLKPHLVARFSGDGDSNTGRFAVSATWKLAYSYNCRGFGYQGNFAVEEDGGSDFAGVSVNELGMAKTGTSWAYNDAGTHYLQVISECRWTVKAYDEGS